MLFAQYVMAPQFLGRFRHAFKGFIFELVSCHSLGDRKFPPQKNSEILKKKNFGRIASKFAGML